MNPDRAHPCRGLVHWPVGVPAAVGSVAAAGNYMIASTISRAGRAAARLEEASRKLSADGVEGDQFLF